MENNFDCYWPAIELLVRKLAVKFFKNLDDREDAIQEARIQLFRKFHYYNHNEPLSTWTYCVITNLFLSIKRKQNRTPLVTSNLEFGEATYSDYFLEDNDLNSILLGKDILAYLSIECPEHYRNVVFEESMRTIATKIKASSETVFRRIKASKDQVSKIYFEDFII